MTTAWPEVALGDICQFKYGKSMPASARSGLGFPVFGSNGEVGRHEDALTSGPTIVVGRKGSFGEVHFSESACWPIDTTYFIDESATSQDLRWLFYLLGTLGLTELNRAAAIPGLNRADAYRKRFPLPPIDEQRRIAAILDKADGVRAKRKAALETLETLSQAIFVEMFGSDGVGPLETLGKLLESASVFTDGDWVESKDQDPKGSVRLIQLADIGDGFFVDKSARFLTRQKSEELRCTFLKPGDVLVARMPDPLGRACIFPDSPQECVTVVDVCVIRPDGSEIDPVWLTASINSPRFRLQISSFATGTTRSRISRSNLSKLSLRVAPIARQREFAAVIQNLEQAAFALKVSGNGLDNLFFSLQQKAFQGTL